MLMRKVYLMSSSKSGWIWTKRSMLYELNVTEYLRSYQTLIKCQSLSTKRKLLNSYSVMMRSNIGRRSKDSFCHLTHELKTTLQKWIESTRSTNTKSPRTSSRLKKRSRNSNKWENSNGTMTLSHETRSTRNNVWPCSTWVDRCVASDLDHKMTCSHQTQRIHLTSTRMSHSTEGTRTTMRIIKLRWPGIHEKLIYSHMDRYSKNSIMIYEVGQNLIRRIICWRR